MIDVTAIWETVKPYITTTGGITAVVTFIVVCIKGYAAIKSAANAQKISAEANSNPADIITTAVTNAIPTTLKIDINKIVEPYLENMTKELTNKLDEEVEAKIIDLTGKIDLALSALKCLKSVSDSVKDEISEAVHEKPEETVLTVQLTSNVVEAKKEEAAVVYTPIE